MKEMKRDNPLKLKKVTITRLVVESMDQVRGGMSGLQCNPKFSIEFCHGSGKTSCYIYP